MEFTFPTQNQGTGFRTTTSILCSVRDTGFGHCHFPVVPNVETVRNLEGGAQIAGGKCLEEAPRS